MSPRPQAAHLRRPEILVAAAEAIRERGVNNTRVADVADRVGTSAPSVLYYFESKTELLSAALVHYEERFYEDFDQELQTLATAREKLVRLVESMTLGRGDWDLALWMELWPQAMRDEDLADTREGLDGRWRAMIASIVREGQLAGEFGPANPDDVALVLGAILDGFAIQVTLGDSEATPERARRLCMALLERELNCDFQAAGVAPA